MTALADILHIEGVQRADDVVSIAFGVRLELAAACALFDMESSGGQNVFGRDAVPDGGVYVKGGPVTEATYGAYARWRDQVPDGRGRLQGVGPCQLTAIDFQRQADRLGGCWRWEINVRIGFGLLANYIVQYGARNAFVAYNGGRGAIGNAKSPAQSYADKAMARLDWWRTRLAGAATTGPIPTITEDDMPYTPEDLTKIVRDAVWGTLLPDYYAAPGDQGPRPAFAAGEVMAWACTHAANARDRAAEARDVADQIQHIAQTAVAAAPEIDYTALAAALLQAATGLRAPS